MNHEAFKELIWQKGRELYRAMPWRDDTRGYYVLVSELMLQQTQVERVVPKFSAFTERFPDLASLAEAPLADVLRLWNGLGYNRRAKFLHEAARKIMYEFNGSIPETLHDLKCLPGVGSNTAGAIMTYVYNQPVPFVETNVRTVYFEHFYSEGKIVSDKELLALIGQTLDTTHPREFYWALMDYGAWLKKSGAGRLGQSKHYKKQTPLKGSVREARGQIIRSLTEKDRSRFDLELELEGDDRFETALEGLMRDGLVQKTRGKLHLTK